MALNSTAIEKITDSRPVLIQGGGGIKTPEIKAEDAAALQQAAEMIFRAQRPQASCDEQNRQHRDASYGETPENRYRRGHRSLL